LQDRDSGQNAVIVTASNRIVKKVVTGFFKSNERTDVFTAAFNIRMAGFPIIGFRSVFDQNWIC